VWAGQVLGIVKMFAVCFDAAMAHPVD
jgi:hypothetical protein